MRFFAFFALFLMLAFPAEASDPPQHSQAELFAPFTAYDGGKARLGLRVTLEDGWKTYWRTPGDAGLAPVLDWEGSGNFTGADIRFPAPRRFTIYDLDNFGYEKDVVFPLDVTAAEPDKPLALRLKLDLLVCSDICVPETHSLSLDLPPGKPEATQDLKLYEAALENLPRPAGGGFSFASAALRIEPDNSLFLAVEAKAEKRPARAADLFVEHSSGLTFGKPVIDYDPKAGILRFRAPVHSIESAEKISALLASSPVRLTFVDGEESFEGTIAPAAAPIVAPAPPEEIATPEIDLRLVFFAFLGGLILNLMPCVLPVLSLKVLSVMSHGGSDSRRSIFRNFMASAAGILASFWMMGAVLTAVKSAGGAIGWGIQFQHPAFLVFLMVVVTLFALNLWGIFEIPLPRVIAKNIPARHEHEPTLAGHFLTGAFATLLATPCTAPFLGTAVGFALAGGGRDIFVIFTFLGLGLAFPYIVLALSPKLFRHMPKPGKWMVTLKRFLALALALTAIWLGNVLLTVTTQPTLDAGWRKFDPALIAPAVAEGKTVIVDITADWCLTCKANKRLVLEQGEVMEAISGDNILRLQGDWTHRDETIAAYLKSFGKYGIPFNVVYGPAAPQGVVLPELLTRRAVMDALAIAAGE